MTIGNYLVYGEPIKGWTLLRSLGDDEENRVGVGEWVLAYTKFFERRQALKYPSFIFKELPLDGGNADSDKEIKELIGKARVFEKSMRTDPETGFGFYQCCLNAGYNPLKEEFYTWVAERLTEKAYVSQSELSADELQKLLDILVCKEEFEKAAMVRDALTGKYTKGLGIF